MRHVLSFILFLALGLPVLAQGIERADEPDWVDDLSLPRIDPALRAEALDGVFYQVSDHQIRWDGAEKQSYGRTVMEVTDRAGLEQAASLSFDFDPAFDRLILTRLVRIRDGVATDLRDTLREDVFRRETRLEEGIIDGTLTAVIQIPDLRVGDVVDYASIRVTKPIVPEGERSGYSTLEWGVPVGVSRTVLYWPQDWPLMLGAVPERVTYRAGRAVGGVVRHEWRREGHVPPRSEDDVPVEADPTAYVRYSDQADWSALAGALTPYYSADYPLTPEWEAKLAVLQAAHFSDEDRAIAALRLVQDEVRYVSLSVGAGGYFARLPEEVIRSGFGDCKDKSLLLRVLLGRMGITAQVALTNFDAGHGLPDEVPMLGAFDHMIVRIQSGGSTVWVDPTASHQGGGFATGMPPDYGWGLPLTGAGQRALEPIPVTPNTAWSNAMVERFQFTPLGVFFEVTTEFGGGAADSARQRWATTPVSQITADYLEYYQRRYPGLTLLEPAQMNDVRQINRVTVEERYFLPVMALSENGLREDFAFASENFTAHLPERMAGARTLPLYTGGVAEFRHRVEVRSAPIEFIAPDEVQLVNSAFDFSFQAEVRQGGWMTLDWAFVMKQRSVPPELAAGIIADAGKVSDQTWFTWDLTPD